MHAWVPKPRETLSSRQVSDNRRCHTDAVGPLMTPFDDDAGDTFPHSMEPQLRALGLHTTLIRGVPSLNTPHQLCKAGDILSSEQCRILKLLGVQMAVSTRFGTGAYLTGVPHKSWIEMVEGKWFRGKTGFRSHRYCHGDRLALVHLYFYTI